MTAETTEWAGLVWSPCGEDKNVNINTELRVSSGGTNDTSFMTMDSTDGDISTVYHMAWKECPRS